MKVGILGFGNVAAATIESFLANQDLILAKARVPIELVRIATRTPSRAHGRAPVGCQIGNDPHALVDDPQLDVVIELTGNVPLGRELVLRALEQGKHVITANKALLARDGAQIMACAARAGRRVLFEGAVAVSIPIIKTLREAAAANRIASVVGILNGTSNYVLSQMSEHGADFSTALAEAQRRGYAEADPTLDINGEDAAHKITLLASLAFGVPIDFEQVRFKGISDIEREDIEFAKRLGHQVKLIAQAKRVGGGLVIGVQPTLVPNRSMLAMVGSSMNGIALQGDLLGSAFLYGSGAGGKETSSAVLADLLELANGSESNSATGAYNMGFRDAAPTDAIAEGRPESMDAFYIRLRLDDRAGTLAEVSRVLATAGISAHSLLQDAAQGSLTDLVVITHPVSEERLRHTLPQLRHAAGRDHSVVVLPVLEDCGC
ncbi:MAG TPA: homoserine dehydrogenase [Trinickia sp.]|jgi:homoserine dehydrogenase|uniref:homoserine dehydrogenase n=1 Tax=Trinickia sp. TaxID=2571163 RepID=UPI002F3ECE74